MITHRADATKPTRRATAVQVPSVSQPLWRLFGWYTRRYLGRAFHSVRLSGFDPTNLQPNLPIIVYVNHPSWWDPLLCLFLAQHLLPKREHYAPMQAAALERYRFFKRLGFFAVEAGTRKGAMAFLRVSQAILQQPSATLWVTAEGRFTDPRHRPVELMPGIGHLAARLSQAIFLPVAIEYPFWEERFPEALIRIGEPRWVGDFVMENTASWTTYLAAELECTQDALAYDARRRCRDAFQIILQGRVGIGGVYDLWRALRARWWGEAFSRPHGGEGS